VIAQQTSPIIQWDHTTATPAAQETASASRTAPRVSPPSAAPVAPKTPAARRGPLGVLFARKGPQLSVETVGPSRIAVGRESTYELIMQNAGETAAEEVTVFVSLPAWADVLSAETSSGATQPAGNASEPLQWKIGRLEANSREKLALRLMPRQSRPFELGVRWDYKPIASQARIEVQEPKLGLSLEGPREVLYGVKQIYKLRLLNSGNGDAENVAISLVPLGTGEGAPVTQNIGTIAPGEQRTIEIELVARQAGELTVQVEVRGDGGVKAQLAEKVVVRRAALGVDVSGPGVQFVGTAATYRIRARNTGNAPATNLHVAAQLPAGAKYLSGSEHGQADAVSGKVQWRLGNLPPGAERTLDVKCLLGAAGNQRLEVVATADDELNVSASAATQVEAMADLVLQTQKPSGPTPVGEDAVYEIRVRNQGTKSATDVSVVAYFSRGIEPVGAEGGSHRTGPGQVVFEPIAAIAAGSEVVLKVTARAESPGNHVFRAEVLCKPLGSRLASEETAFFYSTAAAPSPEADGQVATPIDAVPRTAERNVVPATPQAHEPTLAPPPAGQILK